MSKIIHTQHRGLRVMTQGFCGVIILRDPDNTSYWWKFGIEESE